MTTSAACGADQCGRCGSDTERLRPVWPAHAYCWDRGQPIRLHRPLHACAHGLALTLYREYDPNVGRWLATDLIREAGGLNVFAYAANSPIGNVDPDGLDVRSAVHSAKEGAKTGFSVTAGLRLLAAVAGAEVAAVASVGLASYSPTILAQQIAFGIDPYMGREICFNWGDSAAGVVGALLGGGFASVVLALLCQQLRGTLKTL